MTLDLPSGWRKTCLGDVAEMVTKGTTPTTLGRAFVKNGLNFVKAESIDSDGGIIHEKLAAIDTETHALLSRSQLKAGDLLFSIAGVIGRTALVSPSILPANTNQAIAIIRVSADSQVNARYLYYQLRSLQFLQHGLGRVVQTAQANLSLAMLKQAPIVLPPIEVQATISEILGAIDDLILNNRQRMHLLERMAQAIYREWFVHFRYPGYEDAILSESSLGPIPEGWRAGTIDELVSIVTTTVAPAEIDPDTPAVGLEHIPRRQLTLASWGAAGELASRKTIFQVGDVLFGKIRPYFHKVSIAPMNGICSTDAIVIRPWTDYWGPAVFTLASDSFVANATQTSNGTKMPRADWRVVKNFPVAVPPVELARRFTEIAKNALGTAQCLMFASRALATMRDILLPKLVTGQIDVSNMDLDALVDCVA